MERILLFAALVLLALLTVLAIAILVRSRPDSRLHDRLDNLDHSQDRLAQGQAALAARQDLLVKTVDQNLHQLARQAESAALRQDRQQEALRAALQEQLQTLRESTDRQLNIIRKTVDDQLQDALDKKLTESFKQVSDRLEQVYKGLGEMQTVAASVGDLKKVLSNVKTRGILGEIQLGAILQEILSPEQYAENIATVKGSSERVEFAVRLPGEDGNPVWLPIDAKFPADAYSQLMDAYDSADPQQVEAAQKLLRSRVRSFAKDIHDKYIAPPDTTDFGIMFVPIEGLYAELVRAGMVETLQHDFRVCLTGPTTMGALLNSLQMGFKTLAIQKRSSEVWDILGKVKGEFDTFAKVLEQAQNRINQANQELDKLVGVRTRMIQRALKDVEALPSEARPGAAHQINSGEDRYV